MNVLTIGGATQDMFLRYSGADLLHITRQYSEEHYMIFRSGTKIEVDEIQYHTGGGSTNSAVSFQRLGFETTCFCKLGSDGAGKQVLSELAAEGINTSTIAATNECCTGTSCVINSLEGDRTIFAYRGANGRITSQEVPKEMIAQSDQLYITSLSLDSAALLPEIVAEAQKHNVAVAINPGVSQLAVGTLSLKRSLEKIHTLILNSSEAKTFMFALVQADEQYKETLKCLEDQDACPPNIDETTPNLLVGPIPYENYLLSLRSFFKEVLRLGVNTVVVTDGRNGVYVAYEKQVLFHPAIDVKVVDTLGAGDSFGSCFVGMRAAGHSHADALRAGMLNSASVISHVGAKPGLLKKDVLEKQVAQLDATLLHTFDL